MEEAIRLTRPLTDADVEKLRIGDRVIITGVIYTARDAAHKRLVQLLEAGEPLPFDLQGQVIYYVGPSPAKPGRQARRDNEYERCGTANVFCAVEPKAGRHFTFPTADRSGFEFAKVLLRLALKYPKAETIHLVMDNLSSHHRKSLADTYGPEVAPEQTRR